eukprot:NODE_2594_length_669_cov_462.806452_g2131_i0.p1 GENE.NODE_2594_length_669_cov_462.806452_g2131_i0~~NODE_2594_length_669_cov_462.806452_g2131_i0.p1  ORF type:complete len:148 (+),score=21.74 NODE_2594_length_669_cov_462.806452_g2131_i0:133-576(+)
MPLCLAKASEAFGNWKSIAFNALVASILLLCMGFQQGLGGKLAAALYPLFWGCSVALIEMYEKEDMWVDAKQVTLVDFMGAMLRVHIYRGVLYLIISLPLFGHGWSAIPPIILDVAAVRYMMSSWKGQDVDVDAGDAGIPLMSTQYH